ncbi:tyrosine-type recombinase/integrase [Microbacterium aurugineum]
MATRKYRARLWNPDTKVKDNLGYYDTEEERDLVIAQAKLARSQGRLPKVIEDRTRGGERFVTFAERTLLDRKRRVALTTWTNYNSMLQRWVVPYFGEMKLRDIRSRDVDKWFNEHLPQGSPSNGQRYSVLSLIMRRAVLLEEISSSPCVLEGVSATKSKRRPTWSWSEFYVLHDAAATDQERALLWVLAGSGCRIGEALALNVEDVDLDYGDITVKAHVVGTRMVEGTKAHADQVRHLSLLPQAVDALRTHLASSKRLLDEPVFMHSRGGRMHYDTARRMFDSIRKSRGLETFTIHDVRHLSLTEYGRTGASLAEIMARGGHSDHRTAMRYQHASRERDRALVAKMAQALA